jgi:anti-anti-sigma factor
VPISDDNAVRGSGVASFAFEQHGDIVLAELYGDVDRGNAAQIGADICHAVSNKALGIVVDLSRITYFDSSGIRMLFDLARWLERRQQRLHLVVPDGAIVATLLDLVQIRTAAELFSTRQAAVAGPCEDPN